MISVKIIKTRPQAEIPRYMTLGAAGCDVKACLETTMIIEPQARVAIPTGLAVAIPLGFEIQVRPRSGLSFKQGLTVVNAPGTIDSDYRGEIMVLAINLGEKAVEVHHGDRIAQLVLNEINQIQFEEVSSLDETARGAGGFGSTGVRENPAQPV